VKTTGPAFAKPASPTVFAAPFPGSGASSPSSSRSSSTVRGPRSPSVPAPSSSAAVAAAAGDEGGGGDWMQVESTPSRVFIYDLAAEIAEAEAAEAADAAAAAARPVFLPDIEKHLMRLPRSLLTGGGGGYEYKGGGAEDVGSDESDDGFDDDDPDEDTRTRRRSSGSRRGAAKNMQLVKYSEPAAAPLTFASSLAALSREQPSSTAHDRRTAAAEARRQRAWDFADADDGPWTGLGGAFGARRSSPDLMAALAAAGVGGYPDDGDAMDIDMDLDLGGDL
jgi:hypothetical protein